ncbi:MAG: hypothetical protein K0Q74_1591, partial [Gammaproteobacteria bacterium]|nr:hypothetical protein [Gammaproteobacteria bacterium]
MFVINIIYKKDFSEIEKHLVSHREFLDQQYKKGFLLMSGPKDPRTGGIIIALGNDQKILEAVF